MRLQTSRDFKTRFRRVLEDSGSVFFWSACFVTRRRVWSSRSHRARLHFATRQREANETPASSWTTAFEGRPQHEPLYSLGFSRGPIPSEPTRSEAARPEWRSSQHLPWARPIARFGSRTSLERRLRNSPLHVSRANASKVRCLCTEKSSSRDAKSLCVRTIRPRDTKIVFMPAGKHVYVYSISFYCCYDY